MITQKTLENQYTVCKNLISFLEDISDDIRSETLKNYLVEAKSIKIGSTAFNRIQLGYFTILDYWIMFTQYCKINEIDNTGSGHILIKQVFLKLIPYNIIINNLPSLEDEFKVDPKFLRIFKTLGSLEAIIFGIQHSLNEICLSIPCVSVKDFDKIPHHGTGLYIFNEDNGKYYILTNKHVLEEKSIIDITSADIIYEVIGIPIFSEEEDLAVVEVKQNNYARSITVYPKVSVLDNVVSVGYPNLPGTFGKDLLIHKGEVNGWVTPRNGKDKYFLMSCIVSGGNSGGPIINDFGLCVGLVTQNMEMLTGSNGNVMPEIYHAAILGSSIIKFLNTLK